MRILFHITICVLAIAVVACNRAESCKALPLQDDSYAENIIITEHEGYTRVDVKNPWDGSRILQSYILVPRDSELPGKLPDATVIRTPITSALVYSAVHANVMKELGHISAVKGVCDAQYFDIPEISDGLNDGSVINVGASMSPATERIIALAPDVIILSPYQNASYGDISRIGVPIVECADYMETSPLGRAEWIKLFGLLLGESEKADSIFKDVEQCYNHLKNLAMQVNSKPKVLSETIINGTWYVPGGNSYMARLFADAGAEYAWGEVNTSGSIPLDMPRVLEKAHDADVWLIKSYDDDFSYSKLKAQHALNAQFKAFKSQRIYFCNTARTTFFQDFPFHPEILLKEYISIFHSQLIANCKLTYFKPLKNE